jgi:Rrf2 family protein
MKLAFTRRTDYALRAALEMALPSFEPRTHRHVARATRAPIGVVKQALADLSRAGILDAARGRAGGYRLSRPAEEISIYDIVSALEPLDAGETRCVLHPQVCPLTGQCPLHPTMAAARSALIDVLRTDTLADLVARSAGDRGGAPTLPSAATEAPTSAG